MHKIKHKLPESCLSDLFRAVNSNYNHRSQCDFRAPGIKFLVQLFTVPHQ